MRQMTSRKTKLVMVALAVALSAGAATGQADKSPGPQDARLELALIEARRVADELTVKVRGLLLNELDKGGFDGAVRVCAEVAQDITRQFNQQPGRTVRRVSLGYRNTRDIPDAYETQKLKSFDTLNRDQKLPQESYEIVRENGREYLRYLRPVTAGAMCLKCHGQPDDIPIAVQRVLQERYPNDQATGYHAGDVRGAVSVRIALPKQTGRQK